MNRSLLLTALCCTLVLPAALFSQISITSSDILKPVGYQFALEYNVMGPITVDVGNSGPNETWNFTSYDLPEMVSGEIVDPAGTPFAADFPTANLCYMDMEETADAEAYSYMNVTSSMWSFLGVGVTAPETSYVNVYDPPQQTPLPIDYLDTYVHTFEYGDTIAGFIFHTLNRSHTTVDAWGSMTIPMGTFDILRTMSYDTTISTIGVDPFVFVDTTTSIDYGWLGKDPLFVANVSSMEGETNPDFTEADWVERARGAVGIDDDEPGSRIPTAFMLGQNFPNPFNPRTDISFQVAEDVTGQVDLSIYSLRGTKVRTLVSGALEPGTYSVTWDGRSDRGENLPSGVYFYRLTAEGESFTRKMILAK